MVGVCLIVSPSFFLFWRLLLIPLLHRRLRVFRRIRCCFLGYRETSEAASTHVGGFCPSETTTTASFRCTIFIHVVETLLNRFSAFNPFVLLNMHISGILHWLWFDLKFQTSLLLLSPLFSQLEQFRQCGIRDHYFLNFLLVNLSDVPTMCLVL